MLVLCQVHLMYVIVSFCSFQKSKSCTSVVRFVLVSIIHIFCWTFIFILIFPLVRFSFSISIYYVSFAAASGTESPDWNNNNNFSEGMQHLQGRGRSSEL